MAARRIGQPKDATELDAHSGPYRHAPAYLSMYAEPSCSCTPFRQCPALESSDPVSTPAADPVLAPARELYPHHRSLVKAPEQSKLHQEFLDNLML